VLRILVAALLAANLCFVAWSQGWLDGVVSARSIGDREPERVTRQVHPELVRVLGPTAASAASAGAASVSADPAASSAAAVAAAASSTSSPADSPASTASSASAAAICLEAGPFTDADVARAQTAAQKALSGAVVSDQKSVRPGVWLVYMGRYANQEALQKKEEELKRRKLQYTEVAGIPNLMPGLSLGRFTDRDAAAKAMDQFTELNIHTAHIVQLVPATTVHLLRVETDDTALAKLAGTLKLGAPAKGFSACATPKA
jgi:hypothetical protein